MPDVIYMGPADVLFLEEGGRAYHPGDKIRLSQEALGNLTRQGERFAHAHSEEEAAAIEAQIHPPEFVPPAPPLVSVTEPAPEPAPKAKKESD